MMETMVSEHDRAGDWSDVSAKGRGPRHFLTADGQWSADGCSRRKPPRIGFKPEAFVETSKLMPRSNFGCAGLSIRAT